MALEEAAQYLRARIVESRGHQLAASPACKGRAEPVDEYYVAKVHGGSFPEVWSGDEIPSVTPGQARTRR
jgi:hypothetical protein